MAEILLEVCVDDVTGFDVAVANGADRIELCSTLELGGLTPSAGLMRHAADCPIAVYALIRPRAGDFIYSDAELKVMCADIDAARACGLRGVVFGASNKDGSLNEAQLARLVAHSKGMGITLHRAFDLASANFEWAVNQAVNLGFERILTSGGAATAVGGIEKLREIFRYAADRMTIMPGAGIDAASVVKLCEGLPLREVHASCSSAQPAQSTNSAKLGFGLGRRVTEAKRIMALKLALQKYHKSL